MIKDDNMMSKKCFVFIDMLLIIIRKDDTPNSDPGIYTIAIILGMAHPGTDYSIPFKTELHKNEFPNRFRIHF